MSADQSQPTRGFKPPASGASRVRPAAIATEDGTIFFLACTIVFVTFTLNQHILNLVENYTVSGGNFFSKFHPATYISGVLLIWVLLDRFIRPLPLDRGILAFIGIFLIFILYLGMKDQGAAASCVVDVRLAPTILILGLSRLDQERVRKVCALYVWIAVANGIAVILDFVRGAYLFPFDPILLADEYFRPAGFAGHSTQAAMMGVIALFFVMAGAIKANVQRPLMLFFLLTVALCKERAPMALAVLLIVVNAFYPFIPRRNKWDRIVDLGVTMIIPVVVFAAFLLGAFDRALGVGAVDNSTLSRIRIYETLYYLTPDQLLNGVKVDVATALAMVAVNSKFIESSFLIATFAGGLPFACVYVVTNFFSYWRFIRTSLVFGALILLVAVAGDDFMVKGLTPGALTLLGYFLWRTAAMRTRKRAPAAVQTRPQYVQRYAPSAARGL